MSKALSSSYLVLTLHSLSLQFLFGLVYCGLILFAQLQVAKGPELLTKTQLLIVAAKLYCLYCVISITCFVLFQFVNQESFVLICVFCYCCCCLFVMDVCMFVGFLFVLKNSVCLLLESGCCYQAFSFGVGELVVNV